MINIRNWNGVVRSKFVRRSLPAIFCSVCLFVSSVFGADAGTVGDCAQSKELDRAIAACSAAIQSNPEDARSFFQRGLAHFLKFDYERAFADYEAAIRLNPQDSVAHHMRGVIFQIWGNDDRAIDDFTKALALGSNDVRLFVDRGTAYAAKGATSQSLADYDRAIRVDPKSPFAYLLRGIAYTYGGELEQAQADFKRGFEVEPNFPHFMLWLHIAERRAGKPSSLAAAVPKLDMTKWPNMAVRMFLGEETTDAVLARGAANLKIRHYGDCESDFFVAEFMYLQNRRDDAIRFYKSAQKSCRRNFVEWIAATYALRSLGVDP